MFYILYQSNPAAAILNVEIPVKCSSVLCLMRFLVKRIPFYQYQEMIRAAISAASFFSFFTTWISEASRATKMYS